MERAGAWAREHGQSGLCVETQDVNVAACRCYSALGFRTVEVREDAYPDAPGEAMILWRV